MRATCGIYCLNRDYQLLITHPTNAKNIGCWSIPKGEKKEGETYFDAAKREFNEETGLYLYNQDTIMILDPVEYISKIKTLYSFLFYVENFDTQTPVVCESFTKSGDPENDISIWIDVDNPGLDVLLHESQIENLNKIRQWVKSKR